MAVNFWLGRHLVGAASAPNRQGDPLGGINHAFRHVQALRLWGKAVKARSRVACCALMWPLFGTALALWP